MRRVRRVHSDQRGTISIVSVFTLLMFTMLLVMIVNVGTHFDDKLKMQNAADASTYSGGVVLARGMNGLAFTNHLISDVFAMTAFLREARDRNAESLVPPVLAAWQSAGEKLASAPYRKFATLGDAILRRVPQEQEAVTAWGELSAASSDLTLPVFERILSEQLISEFQRELLRTIPVISQQVTDEIARRHGATGAPQSSASPPSRTGTRTNPGTNPQTSPEAATQNARGEQVGVLWRTRVLPVALGDETDPQTRTLPVVDPDPQQRDFPQLLNADEYLDESLRQRRTLATHFLNLWNFDRLRLFNYDARMSSFLHLWRIATCGQLERLLNIDYPVTNVPMILRYTAQGDSMESLIERAERLDPLRPLSRRRDDQYPIVMDRLRTLTDLDDYMEQNFHFVGVVYRQHRSELGPGLFENPLASNSDGQTFSQVSLFVPRPRKRKYYEGDASSSGDSPDRTVSLGGTFGFTSQIEVPRRATPSVPTPDANTLDRVLRERWALENYPTHWDLLNQNWMVQLVPLSANRLPEILQTNPGGNASNIRLPTYGQIPMSEIKRLNTH